MESPTVWQWIKQKWPKLLAGLIGLLVLLLITVLIASNTSRSSLSVRPMWPARFSTTSPSKLFVSVNKHGKFVKDANVTVFEYNVKSKSRYSVPTNKIIAGQIADGLDNSKIVAKGKTDQYGVVLVDLPKVKFQPQQNQKFNIGNYYVLKVEADGDVKYAINRIQASNVAPLSVIQLDRPLYKPGQDVKMRAMYLDADENKPVSGQVTWRVTDPMNNLIFEQKTTISAAGIAHTSCALARGGLQGVYKVETEYAGTRKSQHFEVRPFKLPKFKVEVIGLTKQAKRGETLKAQVIVTYNHGERVKGAKTTVRLGSNQFGKMQYLAREGQTDKRGIYEIEWKVPDNTSAGSSIEIQASAITETGHSQQGKTNIPVAGHRITTKVHPLDGPHFYWNQSNRGVLEIKDGLGKPVAEAKIKLYLQEEKTEREVELTTDNRGRAIFDWHPKNTHGARGLLTVKVTFPDGTMLRKKITPNLQYGQYDFRLTEVTAEPNKPFSLQVKGRTVPGVLIAYRRGMPLATAVIPKGPTYHKIELNLDQRARGLVHLVNVDGYGNYAGTAAIVVNQRGSKDVKISPDKVLYKPGSKAKVTLSFDAHVDEQRPKTETAPVTYGLVGVDEALYTLKARTNLPLMSIMRQDPQSIGLLLEKMKNIDPKDQLDQQLFAMTFQRTLGGQFNPTSQNRSSDVTRQVKRIQAQPRKKFWIVVLCLILLALSVVCARFTFKNVSKNIFGWKQLGKFIGVAILALPVGFVLIAMGQQRSLAGGLFVWGLVLGAWFISAAWANPQIKFGRWLWVILTMAIIGTMLVITQDSSRARGWEETFIQVTMVASLAIMGIQVLLWPFILKGEGESHASYGIATLLALPFVGLIFGVAKDSRRYDSVMEKATGMNRAAPSNAPARIQVKEEENDDGIMASPKPESGKGKNKGPRVRSYFPETMVWMPEVRSDVKGDAVVNIEVPDSITTWRLNAWANTWDGRLGEGQQALKVWQDFFVEVNLPMYLTQGDLLDVPVTLVNNRELAMTVALSTSVDDPKALRVLTKINEGIVVEPGARKTIYLKVEAGRPGQGALTVIARTDSAMAGDAVKHEVEIAPDGRSLTRSASGFIQDEWRQSMLLPRDAIDGSYEAQVKLFPSPIADALDGLDSMVKKPNGCFEQTSSANYPNVIVMQALKKIAPKDWPSAEKGHAKLTEKTEKMLHIGYQRMLGFQKSSGGFALYPSYKKADIMLTAYGLMQLSQMSKVRMIDKNVMQRAVTYLISRQNKNGTWPIYASRVGGGSGSSADIGQVRSTAFVLLALLESDFAKDRRYAKHIKLALDHIEKRYDSVSSPNSLALAANALWLGDRKASLNKVLGILAASLKHNNQTSYWTSSAPTWIGARSRYADVETTAIASYVFNKTAAKNVPIGKILQYLAQSRSYYGGWGSTQATVWTLRTLMSLTNGAQQKVTLDLLLDGKPLPTANGRGVAGVANVDSKSILIQHYASPKLNAGEHTLLIKPRSGKSASVAQVSYKFAVPWRSAAAKVSGEHLSISAKTAPKASFGQLTSSEVIVRNQRPITLSASIVELPLPPGSYAPTPQFDMMKQARHIDHYEITPKYVRLYISGFKANEAKRFVYKYVPLMRGKMSIPAVRAYVYYTPDPLTEVDGGNLFVD